jgi:hypothetical protein
LHRTASPFGEGRRLLDPRLRYRQSAAEAGRHQRDLVRAGIAEAELDENARWGTKAGGHV